MYPRIVFFVKLSYPRIHILRIPIRVSVSVLLSLSIAVYLLHITMFILNFSVFEIAFVCYPKNKHNKRHH
jgi:hypothetical protein